MKRFVSILLVCLLLTGCTSKAEDDSIYFVYPRKDYIYSISQGTVARERRDVTEQSLEYLVRLYLLGPQDEELEAIYPAGIRLEELELSDKTLSIRLSAIGNQLADISFTLAGACLAQTCFSLCQANYVTVSSGDHQVTLKRDAFVFQDDTATLETAAPQTE